VPKKLPEKQCVVVLNAFSRQAVNSYLAVGDSFTARLVRETPQGVWIESQDKVPGALGKVSAFIPYNAMAALFIAERGFRRRTL
jgi:hypothetical protein